MKKSELRNIIKEELLNVLNEDVFVMWADRVTGDLNKAIKKAKYKGKGGTWSSDFKTNAKEGHGTVFFVSADNVAEAKKKLLSFTEKNKVDDNVYRLSENAEKYTYERIGNKLIKTGQVKKGMPENEMIKQIVIQTKKEYGDKKAKYMVKYDEDYLPDVISYINDTLRR